MKIRPLGGEMFRADRHKDRRTDRQGDMTKLIAAFHNFLNAPQNEWVGPRAGLDVLEKR